MTDTNRAFSRREILTGAAALGVGGAMAGIPSAAWARAPLANTQAPAFYRFKVGTIEATVITDGPLPLGEPKSDVFTGLSKDEFTTLLTDRYQPTDNVVLEQNVLMINNGDHVTMFDTGLGSVNMFGPSTGRLVANLKAAGIEPQSVDAIVLTHAHVDHLAGIMSADRTPNFPNAQIYISQADYDFWTDEGKLNIPLKDFIQIARANLVPNRERIVFFKDGQEFLPGVQAMATPGHTVGHTSFMIGSQGRTLLNLGDVAHHHIVSTERPRAEFAFDTDGQQGVATRQRVFDMLSSQRVPFIAYHFPWPGIGHVGKAGDAYRYYPTQMRMVL